MKFRAEETSNSSWLPKFILFPWLISTFLDVLHSHWVKNPPQMLCPHQTRCASSEYRAHYKTPRNCKRGFGERVEDFFKNEIFQTTCCSLGHFLCYQVHWGYETGTAKNKSLNVFFSFRLRDCQEQQSQRIILIFLGTQIILRHHQCSVLKRKGFTL